MLSLLFSGGLDPDAQAWARTVTASPARVRRVSATIKKLKGAGIWPLLDRCHDFAAENSMQARTCWKTRIVLSFVNTPTFTANRGVTGDGLSSYIDPNITPNTLSQFALTSGSAFAYLNSSRAGAQANCFGVLSNGPYLYPRTGTGNTVGLMNSGVENNASPGAADTLGLFSISRVGTALTTYKRDALIKNITDAASGVASGAFYLLALQASGVPTNFETARLAVFGMGAGLSAAQISALNTIIENHLTPIGANA